MARNLAKQQNYNPNLNEYLPYYIQISYLKQYIHKEQNNKWQKYRENYIKTRTEKRPIIDAFEFNTFTIKNKLNKIKSHTDRGILIRLMCNETPTNDFLNKYPFYKIENNNGQCEYCKKILNKNIKETSYHIIFECPKYKYYRYDMKNRMAKIRTAIVYRDNWGKLINILFPWKNKYIIPKHSPDKITIQIWRTLIQYLKRTGNRAFDTDQLKIIK